MSAEKSYKSYIHVAVMLVFMFGFGYLPPIGGITALGMQTLGIFIAVIYGWSTLGMIWPSLLGLAALSLLPGSGAIATFKAGFGDRVTVAIFFFLLFGELISKVGLSKFIADWCVSRKFAQGRPYAILIMFCLAGAFVSAFVNCFAGIILIWGVFYSFCDEVGLKPGDPFAKLSLIALIFITLAAGDILPFMGLSILAVGLQQSMLGIAMPYVTFTVVQLFMVVLAAGMYLLLVKFVFKPDTSKVAAYVPKQQELKMNGEQKFVFGLLIGLLVTLFLPGLLPSDWAITVALKALDLAGVLAIVFVIYYVVHLRDGNGVPFSEVAKGMNWSLILMFATVAPLAAAVNNADSGILTAASTMLQSVVGGMNPYLFTIIIILIASIMTQFCNNVAILLMVMPIMLTFATQLGANPVVLTMLAAFNLNIAFCTPAASGPAAMMFSNKKWIGTGASYMHGVIIFVITMLATIAGMFLALALV